MRVIHVLQGLHAAGIEHLALQLIAHSPSGIRGVLLNLEPGAQDLRPAFQACCESGELASTYTPFFVEFAQVSGWPWAVFTPLAPALPQPIVSRPLL